MTVSLHAGSKTFVIGHRRYKALWLSDQGDEWSALLAMEGTNVLLRGTGSNGPVDLELWDSAPLSSQAVAVVAGPDGQLGLAVIPLCSCGERECGHINRQYRIRADEVAILETLEVLEGMDRLNRDPYNSQPRLSPLVASDNKA